MDKIIVKGGTPLNGTIKIGGAKNAALPLICCSLLTEEKLNLENIPNLSDISTLYELLFQHGVEIEQDKENNKCSLLAKNITNEVAPYEIVSKMRASILVLGPLVARHGKAVVSLPGGCAIGTRPVNIHIDGLKKLGASIEIDRGYINAQSPKGGLVGAEIIMPIVSVTGTENLLMAAALAKGRTVLKNAAKEPEVCNLANCLVKMGAEISGIGTDTITIDGVEKLHGTDFRVIPDRIEAATYAIAGAITNGNVKLEGINFEDLLGFWVKLREAGVDVEEVKSKEDICLSDINIKMNNDVINGVDIITEPYPGFPTDIQAQFMALMTVCNGASMITETIFENRFMHVLEFCRMSANITLHRSSALVRGVKKLVGAKVMATDLRASVSLVIAGLVACDETTIQRVYHIDRGYEKIEEKLRACGADIERVKA